MSKYQELVNFYGQKRDEEQNQKDKLHKNLNELKDVFSRYLECNPNMIEITSVYFLNNQYTAKLKIHLISKNLHTEEKTDEEISLSINGEYLTKQTLIIENLPDFETEFENNLDKISQLFFGAVHTKYVPKPEFLHTTI